MSQEFHSQGNSLSIEAQEQIAEQLILFSKALKKGEQPAIESFLEGFSGAARAEMLRELLLMEIEHRGQTGELVSFQEYRERFPDDRDVLTEAEKQYCNEATRLDFGQLPPEPGERLHYVGDYELLEEIGRGGMGVVYKAHQLSLGRRTVAVKMLLNSPLATEEEITRFEREAKLASKTRHSNIVAVYEVGRYQGHPYFSMDYVEGQSLAAMVREHPLPPKEAARYVQVAAQAVHQAHEVGILHRDIKPSNILIDKNDQVRVTDFGLAKELDAAETLTGTEGIVGTPSYMPPEQAEGNQAKIGVCSDVYSLGAVLYHLLTGRPPFAAATAWETMHQVKTQDPVPPRTLNPKVPRDLETICLKCLEKEPEDRFYGSAAGLAADLKNYLEGKPIGPGPDGPIKKGWKWYRRNPIVASLLTLSVVLLVSLSITGVVALKEIDRREKADEARIQAARANDGKRAKSLVESLLTAPPEAVPYASQNLESVKEQALPLLREYFANSTDPVHRLHAAYALSKLGKVDYADIVPLVENINGNEFPNLIETLKPDRRSVATLLDQTIATLNDDQNRERMYRYALLALWMGHTSAAQKICAFDSDPTDRTALIHMLARYHGSLVQLERICRRIDDKALRSAICIAVCRISPEDASSEERSAWADLWTLWYQTAHDSSTHSAAECALRRWALPIPAIQPSPSPRNGNEWFINKRQMTMLRIPKGSFQMGPASNASTRDPAHRVTLSRDFYLSASEVTVGQFFAFMQDPNYDESEKPTKWNTSPISQAWHRGYEKRTSPTDKHPIQNVSWEDAILFCNWLSHKEGKIPCYERSSQKIALPTTSQPGIYGLTQAYTYWRLNPRGTGYRLPTEAEWEYACRAGTTTPFSFGMSDDLFREYVVVWEDQAKTCGSKLPNPWGLFDMHGNVDEWCYDRYGPYSSVPSKDPFGGLTRSLNGSYVARGGAWSAPLAWCTSAFRRAGVDGLSLRGFRVAAVVGEREALPNYQTFVRNSNAENEAGIARFEYKPTSPSGTSLAEKRKRMAEWIIRGGGFLKIGNRKITAIKRTTAIPEDVSHIRIGPQGHLPRPNRLDSHAGLLCFQNLTVLELDRIPWGLEPLATMTNLRTLRFIGQRLTPDQLEQVRGALPNCKIEWDDFAEDRRVASWVLSVGGRITIDDAELRVDVLRQVDLPKYPFRVVDIDLQGFSLACNDDIGRFSALPALESLTVKGANISNEGLKHIVFLANLRVLKLVNTQVTGFGILEMSKPRHLKNISTVLEHVNGDHARSLKYEPEDDLLRMRWLERWNAIARDFDRQLNALPPGRASNSPRGRLVRTIIRRDDPVFGRLMILRPKDRLLRISLARDYVLRGKWENALNEYSRAANNGAPESEDYEYAAVLLLVERKQEYQSLLQQLSKRTDETTSAHANYVLARAASLSSEDSLPWSEIVRRAEQAAEKEKNGWYMHVAGLANLRDGNIAKAIQWFRRSSTTQWHPELNQLAQCLCYCRLGDNRRARQLHENAKKWLESVRSRRERGYYPVIDNDWLEFCVLYREANQQVEGLETICEPTRPAIAEKSVRK